MDIIEKKNWFPPWSHFRPFKASSLTDILQNNWFKMLIPSHENGQNISEGHIGGSHHLLCFIINVKVRKKKKENSRAIS